MLVASQNCSKHHLDLLFQILDASTKLFPGYSKLLLNASCSYYLAWLIPDLLWVLASTYIEDLSCSWARLVKQFQCITNNVLTLFEQHTQVYVAFGLVSFVFVIIKTLHCIGSTVEMPHYLQNSETQNNVKWLLETMVAVISLALIRLVRILQDLLLMYTPLVVWNTACWVSHNFVTKVWFNDSQCAVEIPDPMTLSYIVLD